ncbi:PREDICTED: uncharacterized protein LOC107336587 [Acropora digitifera]|uniref:uncharacterized protein LOC107336587 n=1 Tax=Acropora digitifera TaxID=70779 RepID=UPI00077AB0A0|nr:PREDICTED: uncharacterized protein LOC107336587 [Acropora digitifera]
MDDSTRADDKAASTSRKAEFSEALPGARMKNASTPRALTIMTVNMDGKATAPERRMLLTLIKNRVCPSLVFCQELLGYFDREVVKKWGSGGSYIYAKTGNEAAVLWLKDEFDHKIIDNTDTSIAKIWEELKNQRSDVDVSEVRVRMALVKLTRKGEGASGCQPFLAASWHGPYKERTDDRKEVFKGLIYFLREVCKKEKVSSFIIGGDFNMNTLDVLDLEKNLIVPRYDLTSRAQRKSQKSKKYTPYKDNFIVFNERYNNPDISVSSAWAFDFESHTDRDSNLTKEDHEKFKKHLQSKTEMDDVLDHDPIVATVILRYCKQTESPSSVEAAVDHNLTDSDSPDKNDKDNDSISKDFAELSLE